MNIYTIGRCKLFLNKAKSVGIERNGSCLSNKYVNNHTHLKWRCNVCGCIWKASYNSVVDQNSWCPKCGFKRAADARKYCLDDCINTAAERLGFCDSTEYVDCKTNMHWRCYNGHKWDACYDSILNCGTWCPYCNKTSIGETITRNFFEVGFGKKFVRCRPEWLINKNGNRLELDGYNEKLKVAFEFNGKQHKKEFPLLFHKEKNFSDCVSNDKIKRRLCNKYSVVLIIVDYSIPYENVAKFIFDGCVRRGLKISNKILGLDYKKFDFYNHGLNEEREIIESKGGILLSDKYIDCDTKLDVVCGKGHRFSVSSDKLKTKGKYTGTGTWCPYCAGIVKPTLEYINEFIKLKGKCISRRYIDSQTKLKFCCLSGHVFWMRWNSVQRGHWCRECYYVSRGWR